MQADGGRITFGDYVLDRANARLARGAAPVPLTPKSFDVLYHLASRPDRLVTKEELLSAIWPDVIVSDASVKVCIREVRKALNDDPQTPRFIETVHRRGYRFIGSTPRLDAVPLAAAHERGQPPTRHPLVGREAELSRLAECFAAASNGHRQLVFATGDPGSGKTALIEAFARRCGASIAIGHCFEQFGTSEPYLPVWEALSRLGRERRSAALGLLLARHAGSSPTGAAAALPTSSTEPRSASDRMLRELADAIEGLAADAPLVLVLEDLHWADYSTIDLISALARRQSGARLLLIGTYRPGEVMSRQHPLGAVQRDLLARGLCSELKLSSLDESAVAQYLALRVGGAESSADLARRLHQRTGGHALFLVGLVDDLVERGPGAVEAVPENVRAMLESHLARLGPAERQVLEAAAVAGVEFSAAAVAGALSDDLVEVEQICESLARRHRFLEPCGTAEWPDGTLASQYRFLHELYHNVVYASIPVARQARMHQCLGVRLESAWTSLPGENTAELAVHFEKGRDWRRAVRHLHHAAERATQQYAHREAIDYLRRALAVLDRLPADERARIELTLVKCLAVHLQVTQGFAAPEVRQLHERAHELCRTAAGEDPRTVFKVLWGIWLYHKVRSELREAKALAEHLLMLAGELNDAGALLQAYQSMSVTALCLGELDVTREQMHLAAAIYDPALHAANSQDFGQDPGVATHAFGAVACYLLGDEPSALAVSERALALARQLGQPSSLALALHFAAMLHQMRGDAGAAHRLAQSSIELSAWEGFSFWHAGGTVLRGWATAVLGELDQGAEEIRKGIEAWLATGSRTYHTYHLGLLADVLLRQGRSADALGVLEEAIAAARSMPEGLYEAELHRLRDRCLAQSGQGLRPVLT
jgi:DNA-binding winged helix-turn-helix (wHTH) protein/predicted ATPase